MPCRILISIATVLLWAVPVAGQHPPIPAESEGNDGCLACHESVKSLPATNRHRAIESGCATCHDVVRAQGTPFLRTAVNSLCLACHYLPSLPAGSPPPATVAITPDYSIPGTRVASVKRLHLDRRGVGHPIANHPVGGVPDPLAAGRELTCISCHVPHGSGSPKLLAFALSPGEGVCQRCHKL